MSSKLDRIRKVFNDECCVIRHPEVGMERIKGILNEDDSSSPELWNTHMWVRDALGEIVVERCVQCGAAIDSVNADKRCPKDPSPEKCRCKVGGLCSESGNCGKMHYYNSDCPLHPIPDRGKVVDLTSLESKPTEKCTDLGCEKDPNIHSHILDDCTCTETCNPCSLCPVHHPTPDTGECDGFVSPGRRCGASAYCGRPGCKNAIDYYKFRGEDYSHLLPPKLPSEIIRKKAQHNSSNDVGERLGIDGPPDSFWITAILDYLDEEAQR